MPALQAIEAVSQGSAEAAYSAPGFFAKADTAFIIFSSVPFGPAIPEYMAWIFNGGGLQLSREMFAKHNVVNFPCNVIPPEASGWFRKEIKSVDDLKGLKMRFFGLGAKVMEKLGVATQLLAPGDIFQALQLGTIDATEFSLPMMDQKFGFYQVAKYYYFPGWHQQASWQEVYINKEKWDALSDQHKAAVEAACALTIQEVISEGEASQWKALTEMRDKHGVNIQTWPPEIMAAIEKAWAEVATEESAKNPNFKRVFDHLHGLPQGLRHLEGHRLPEVTPPPSRSVSSLGGRGVPYPLVRLQRPLGHRGPVPVVGEVPGDLRVGDHPGRAATLPCFIDSTTSLSSAWL